MLSSSQSSERASLERAARAAKELIRRRKRRDCSTSLLNFIRAFWSVVEPDRPLLTGWALEAICEHLEAVSAGQINRLLMNVPPGFMKSLSAACFWPAWEWGPLGQPSMRYVDFSYSSSLTERDNQRFGAIVSSPEYQAMWGKTVTLPPYMLGRQKVANKQTGWKIASSVGGVGTGERADRILIDDPHNVKMAESKAVREETVRWFRESITSRMNDPEKSAIVVIMQRVHEDDLSGCIYNEMQDYTTLCIPMEFDGAWRGPTSIGWRDPRADDGELAFPERFPADVVVRDKVAMGPFGVSAQFQQSPAPRGGGIILRDWWQVWPPPAEEYDGDPSRFPPLSYVLLSVDTAYGEKEENDWNACTSWGVWQDKRDRPQTVMLEAWRKRCPLRGRVLTRAEKEAMSDQEVRATWGLVEWILDTARKRKADAILIEDKSRGTDLAAEVRKLLRPGEMAVHLIVPRGDKVARLMAAEPMFADGMVWAPNKSWSEWIIGETTQFPKGKFDDGVDTVSQALNFLRQRGLLSLGYEADDDNFRALQFVPKPPPIYDI
jgi:predicted phage terminase large subunit-like protein